MQIIQKPAKLIDLVIGETLYDATIKYRQMKYVICSEVENGNILVFNNLTKTMLLLNPNEYRAFENLNFQNMESLKENLVKMLFLVKEDFDEKKITDSVRNIGKNLIFNKEITGYIILPTTACNARCFYCYEAGTKAVTMDENTAMATAEYIIKKSGGKKVNLGWFGGEPLCNTAAINTICKHLSNNNIEYSSTMTTNGYLFDENKISVAINEWNLKAVQITLDGLSDTYNRVKNYKNGDINAFERVINNIMALSNAMINVRIRLNMDNHNSKEIYQLVDYLYEKFKNHKNISVYVMPLYENVGFIKTVHTEDERKKLTEECIKLTDYFNEIGFGRRNYTQISDVRVFACQADDPQKVMILPNGNLGFCEHYLEDDSFGNVYDYNSKKPQWCDYRKPIEKCNDCPYYPTCIVMDKCGNGSLLCDEFSIYSHINSIKQNMKNIYKKHKEENKI